MTFNYAFNRNDPTFKGFQHCYHQWELKPSAFRLDRYRCIQCHVIGLGEPPKNQVLHGH